MLQDTSTTAIAPPSAEAIHAAAAQVLAGPEFRLDRGAGEPITPWLTELVLWILGGIVAAFRFLQGLPLAVRLPVAAVLLAILTVVLWQLAATILALLGARRPGLSLARRDRAPLTPETLEADSARAAAAGDLVTAVRRLYQAALRRIELARGKPWPRGLTDREVLARHARGPLHAPLAGFVDTLERAWYGDRPCTPADLDACRGHHERIVALAATLRPSRATAHGGRTTEAATDALAT